MTRLALWLALVSAAMAAAPPAAWVPVRWEGGPLELARRAGDKALAKPELRDALAGWYDPATLGLLDGTPINCLLVTLSAGGDPQIEKRQWQLVTEYARRAHARRVAVVGLVYPGADPVAVAAAAGGAQLDGIALEGKFPGGLAFAERLEKILRGSHSAAVVIPIAPSPVLRPTAWPVLAVEGVSPEVGKADDSAAAGPTGGVWLDSNMWLARSLHAGAGRPVWISHHPQTGSPGMYARSIADAAADGARWMVTLDDDLRAGLLRREAGAMAVWRGIASDLAFFESRPEWRAFAPFGKVGIVLDANGPAVEQSEEYINLVARRRIPYRVLYRADLGAATLAGLRAALAFDLAPATEAERTTLRAFAAQGGTVLTGPSWGGPPKDQSYTVQAEGEGEIAVYKENAPDPQSVARDLNDLIPDPELGVSIANSPSVLSSIRTSSDGSRMLIQLVNYATEPSQPITVWVTGQVLSARLYLPNGPAVDLPLKRSGGQTEIAVPTLAAYGAVVCSLAQQSSGQ